jgi:hypothetical protein
MDPLHANLGILTTTPPFYEGWLGLSPLVSAHHPEIDHNNIIFINSQDPNQAL